MKATRVIADLLFGAQIVFAVFFCGSELLHLIKNGVDAGVSVTMFLSVELFVFVNLMLALRAHKVKPSRVTLQTLTTYITWGLLWGANVVVLFIAFVKHPSNFWSVNETVATSAVLAGLLVVRLSAWFHGFRLNDPIIHGCNALVFKAVPQLFQAWKFVVYGGASWSGVAVGMGHVTIITRICQVIFSFHEARWDRNRIGSAVSELGNELSWLIATAAWLVWRF